MVQATVDGRMLYKVYKKTQCDDGYGSVSSRKTFIGETYATSQKKAISNVRFRLYGRQYSVSYNNIGGESSNITSFVAEPA